MRDTSRREAARRALPGRRHGVRDFRPIPSHFLICFVFSPPGSVVK